MAPFIVLLSQLSCSLFMSGLIWMVQVVHYPLFSEVGAESFPAYESKHCSSISLLVGPVMLVEMISAVVFVFLHPRQVSTTGAVICPLLLVAVWVSTWCFQIPHHDLLSHAYDVKSIKLLVDYNWIRTVLWTVRSIVLLAMTYRCLASA